MAITGATGSTLTLTNATYADSGWYVADVTDGSGTTRSKPSFVTVAPTATQIRTWGSDEHTQLAVPASLTNPVSVNAGVQTSFAINANGTVVGWGESFQHHLVDAIPPGLNDAINVLHYGNFVLALKSDGTVLGWGDNYSGQVSIPAGLGNVVQIAAGTTHSLALKSDGTVVAWGALSQAQVPAGLNGVVAIVAGSRHNMALKGDGTVVVWSSQAADKVLQIPAGLSGVVAISAARFTCAALKSDGTVVVWGDTYAGENTPPVGLMNVTAVAAGGEHILALKSDGTVTGWGWAPYATPPSDLADVIAISAGARVSFALRNAMHDPPPAITVQPVGQTVAEGRPVIFTVTANGAIPLRYQWRRNGQNLAGQTSTALQLPAVAMADAADYDVVISNHRGSVTSSIATLTVRPNPVVTLQASAHQVLAPGQALTLSVTATGNGPLTYQWTRNGRPIVGATSASYHVSGVGFDDAGYYTAVVTDDYGVTRSAPFFVLVAPAATQLRGWGINDFGQTNTPAGLTDVCAVSAGSRHTLILKKDGTVMAWGGNDSGQCNVPSGLNNVVAIAAGGTHSLALKADGTVVTWGQFVDGTGQTVTPPVSLGVTNVVAIAAGWNWSLVLKSDGTAASWGTNYYGQQNLPPSLVGLVGIAAGYGQGLAVKQDGMPIQWGTPFFGSSSMPVGLDGVRSVHAGGNFFLVVRNNGALVGWGSHDPGQIVFPSDLTGIQTMAVGAGHVLALRSDRTLVSWGKNLTGQATIPAGLNQVLSIAANGDFSYALRDATTDSAPLLSTPASLTVDEAEGASFSVTATGAGPFTYQWRHNGVDIAGATSAAFTLAETISGDAGTYEVVVTNHIGPTTSVAATLVVTPVPLITTQSPARQVINPGAPLLLSVTASGSGALTYQWMHNGNVVPGVTGNTFAVPDATTADSGWYRVLITDSQGTRRSALMFVVVAPAVTQIRAWGDGQYNTPVAVPTDLTDAVGLAVGYNANLAGRFMAIKRNGTVVSWGTEWGGLVFPTGLTDVVQLVHGSDYVLALKSDGTVTGGGNPSSTLAAIPAGLKDVVAIDAHSHALALKADGTVVAWGGSNVNPEAQVPAGLSNVVAISTGSLVSLALKRDGTVVGWGNNYTGQAIPPDGLKDVAAISAGNSHVIALRDDGTVITWGGYHDYPQPVPPGLVGVVSIQTGHRNSSALKRDGTVTSWGTTSAGNLSAPADLGGVIAIAAGYSATLALVDPARLTAPVITSQPVAQTKIEGATADFSVTLHGAGPLTYQWRRNGANLAGAISPVLRLPRLTPAQAGSYDVVITNSLGTATSAAVPLTVVPTPAVTLLSATRHVLAPGQSLALAVSASGNGPLTYQWMRNGRVIPGAIAENILIANVGYADSGWYHAAVTDSNGTRRAGPFFVTVAPTATEIVSWGYVPGPTSNPLPTDGNTIALSSTGALLGLKRDGTVFYRGYGAPPPGGLGGVVAIADGASHHLALKSDGTVVGWATNTNSAAMVPVGLTQIVAIAAGENFSLALRLDGTVTGWGDNYYQQLEVPAGLKDVVAISAWSRRSLALRADGTVVTWGTETPGTVPAGLSDVVEISSGGSFSLARKTDGTLVAWPTYVAPLPLAVSNLPAGLNATTIQASAQHAVALKPDGTVVAWGRDEYGQGVLVPPVGLARVFAIGGGSFALRDMTGDATPAIATQLQNAVTVIGGGATFSIGAIGPAPLTYQWQRWSPQANAWVNVDNFFDHGRNATTPTLEIYDARSDMDGTQYRCVIRNGAGMAISPIVTLTVRKPAFTRLSAGRDHSLQLDVVGDLYGTGSNVHHQLLGNSFVAQNLVPVPVHGVPAVADMAAGAQHGFFITSSGYLFAGGLNDRGQLGLGSTTTPHAPGIVTNGVAAVAAGSTHSAFIKANGELWAMGANDFGQLGNGTTSGSLVPVQVAGGVVDLAAGIRQTLFLKSDGSLWGMGDMNGSGVPITTPVQVATGVTKLAAGGYHSLFIKADGSLWAMGYNNSGQLGTNNTVTTTVPVQIATGVKSVAAGYLHSLFIKNDNSLWAMGYNNRGQIGDGTTMNRLLPYQVADNVVTMSGSEEYSLFSKTDGSLWGMGKNGNGQFGNGTTVSSGIPLKISDRTWVKPDLPTLVSASPVVTGDRVSLKWGGAAGALSYEVWRNTTNDPASSVRIAQDVRWTLYEDRTAAAGITHYYWIRAVNPAGPGAFSAPGSTVIYGTAQLDIGLSHNSVQQSAGVDTVVGTLVTIDPDSTTFTYTLVPGEGATQNAFFNISGARLRANNPAALFPGSHSVRIRTTDGGTTLEKVFVVTVPPVTPAGIFSASAGNFHSLFIQTDGTLWVTGANDHGQLGDGTTTDRTGLFQLASGVSMVAGSDHTLFVKADGTLWAAGRNDFGQLGDGTTTQRNSAVQLAAGVKSVAAGTTHSILLKGDGSLWAVGGNIQGQLGTGDTAERLDPVQIASAVVAIAASNHTLFVQADGSLWATGSNDHGQLGDGTTTERHLPVKVATGVVAVAAGPTHSLFLKGNGTLWAVGANNRGQLGDGTTTDRHLPVKVATGVVAIAAGRDYSLFKKMDGSLFAMGWNHVGQLGDGTTTDRIEPVLVAANVTSFAAGLSHTLLVQSSGSSTAFGANNHGQLGNGGIWGPLISMGPFDQGRNEGEDATFAVMAKGTLALAFQWQRLAAGGDSWVNLSDGGAYSGATLSTLSITGVALAMSGDQFRCVATNTAGSAITSSATLTVYPPLPVITIQGPVRNVVQPGQPLTLGVTATGTGLLHYQWIHNGWPVAGATGSSLALAPVTLQDNGWYVVEVTDDIGTRHSQPIFVIVAPLVTQVVGWGFTNYASPSVSTPTNDIIAVSSGTDRILALRRTGAVLRFGVPSLGDTAAMTSLSDVVAVDVGASFSLALRANGTVISWGENTHGQIDVPGGLSSVAAVSAGDNHALALTGDGRVIAWGANGHGQASVPAGLTGVVAIVAGGEHSLAVKNDGTVVAWGSNSSGQTIVPAGLDDVIGVVAGPRHSLAVRKDGTVIGWGANEWWQSTVPPEENSEVWSAAAGLQHSYLLKRDGTVFGWGSNIGSMIATPPDLAGVFALSSKSGYNLALVGQSAPEIFIQPLDATQNEQQKVMFSVGATGLAPMTFQWRKNGSTIPGATSPNLVFENVALGDEGSYDVLISNSAGSVTSHAVALTVIPNQAPTASLILSSENQVGQSITATVTVDDADGNYSYATLWVLSPTRGWMAIKADNSLVVGGGLGPTNTVAVTPGTHTRSFVFSPTDGSGQYTFALAAVDSLGRVTYAPQQTVTVVNQPPTASFTLSSESNVGLSLTATVTVGDPNGNYSYATLWVLSPTRGWMAINADNSLVVGGGLSPTNTVAATAGTHARSFAFTPTDGPGQYTFALAAVDSEGLVTSAPQQTITVTSVSNQPPTASFTLSSERQIGQSITATVTVGDPNGNYRYATLWVLSPTRGWMALKSDNSLVVGGGLGPANSVALTAGTHARSFNFTPTDGPGHYTFALTAVDSDGATASASQQTITVTSVSNQPPTASFTLSSERQIGQSITATVTVGDPNGNYSYATLWVLSPTRGWMAIKADSSLVVGGGLSPTNTVATTAGTHIRSFAFTPTDGAGQYTFALAAVDSDGVVTSAPQQTITVTSVSNQPPTASFTLSSERTIGQSITATVTVGDPNGNYSYATFWVLSPTRGWMAIKADNSLVVGGGLGPINTVATTAGTHARSFAFTPTDGAGQYTFALTAVDSDGVTTSAPQQTITVTSVSNQPPTASFSLSSERQIGQSITATVTVGDPNGNYSYATFWVLSPTRGWMAIKADNSLVVGGGLEPANTVAATAGAHTRSFAFTLTDGAGLYTFALTAVDSDGVTTSAPQQSITVTTSTPIPSEPTVLYADDFSGPLSHWVMQADDAGGLSSWAVMGGELAGYYPLGLAGDTNTHSFLLLTDLYQPTGDWDASVDFTWSDGRATADFGLWLGSAAKLSLSAGFEGASPTAQTTISAHVRLWDGASWNEEVSGTPVVNLNWTPANWNTATLQKRGNVYRLLINDTEVLLYTDSHLNGQGKLGLHAYGTRTFDDFLLEGR